MKRFIQTLTFLCGPWMILPVGFMVLSYGYKLSNNGIGEAHGIQLFLDGSSDWGGTSLFAATLCAYLVFGFLASWHLTLRLASTSLPSRFLSKFIMSIYFLIPHFILFFGSFSPGNWRPRFSKHGSLGNPVIPVFHLNDRPLELYLHALTVEAVPRLIFHDALVGIGE